MIKQHAAGRTLKSPALITGLLTLALSLLTPGLTPARADVQFLDRVVAIVDQDVIMLSELQRRTDIVSEQLQARGTRPPPPEALREQVLDKMVLDRLQLAKAKENGIRVTDQQLNRTLEKIAASNDLTLAEFKQQLEAQGQSYREAREQIRSEMIITRARERIVNRRIQVSEQEVENFLNSEQGQAETAQELHLAHIMIPVPENPSGEALKKARDTANKAYQDILAGADFAEVSMAVSKSPRALEGGDLGWRKAAELPEALTEAIDNLEAGEVTPPFRMGGGFQVVKVIEKRGGAVQMVEQTKVRHILIKDTEIRDAQQSERLARQLHQRILNGEDFAELAREYSDDTGSGSLGGDLGWALPGQMVPEFEKMMNRTAIGETSPVFKSPFGWHVLQVEDRKQEDLGERILANKARESIRQRKFNEELANWMREIRSEAYIELKL